MLDRKQCVELYDGAECKGDVALFASTSREAFATARKICAKCPVVALCFTHVNPVQDEFTGTCAGKLYYEGKDVSAVPEALPPPVFRMADVDLLSVEAMIDAKFTEWSGYSSGTLMTVCWLLRRKYTLNRISKLSGMEKTYVSALVNAFDDGASPDFKDFIASQISDA